MDNKNVFAANLQRYMEMNRKSRKDVSAAIGVSYYTFTDWVKGKKYPRMDKVEKLAEYFGILKSDLIEENVEERIEEKPTTKSDGLTDTEREALSLFRRLSPELQKNFLELLSKIPADAERE